METSVLTTPLVTPAVTVLHFEVIGITMRRGTKAVLDAHDAAVIAAAAAVPPLPAPVSPWYFSITYADSRGQVYSADEHTGDSAKALIVALNKANLSTSSLERRALIHLASEGKLPANTLTGAPL